jgi:endoglucanase
VGDYLDYLIRVAKSGSFNVEARVACLSNSGIIQVQQLNENDEVLNSCNLVIPVTGGWQTWRTVNAFMNLAEGRGKLRIKIVRPEFNMNWFKFTETGQGTNEKVFHGINIFPNPASDELTIESPDSKGQRKQLVFRTLSGTGIKKTELSPVSTVQKIDIGDLPKGFYFLEMVLSETIYRTKLIIQ